MALYCLGKDYIQKVFEIVRGWYLAPGLVLGSLVTLRRLAEEVAFTDPLTATHCLKDR